MTVARQAVVDQHGLAGGTKHDARWLDVVMDHMLSVQIGKRGRDPGDQSPRLLIRQRQLRQALVESLARDALDHDIGLMGEVADAETGRHVRARQFRQNQLLHLEGDDRGRILTFRHARNLHQQRPVDVGMGDAPQRRHAAGMHAVADREPIDHSAGADRRFQHRAIVQLKAAPRAMAAGHG
jgi:hypothetical protein